MALYFLIKYCEKAEHLLVKWCGFLWQFMLKLVILTELQKKGNKLSVVSSCLCAFPQTFKVKAVQITLTIYQHSPFSLVTDLSFQSGTNKKYLLYNYVLI